MSVEPAGMVSVTTTLCAEPGPAFVTVIVNGTLPPAVNGPAPADFAILTSGKGGMTALMPADMLFAPVTSELVVTVAVLGKAPGAAVGATVVFRVKTSVVPFAMELSRVHVTVPFVPGAGVAHE